MESYITVSKFGKAEIVEKRSRFIASVYPLSDENEAIALINKLKKDYWDARHNVYAYSLKNNGICRYSDDGEPSGTAGMPIVDVLKKRNITDCLIVITRYFGGVLLGTGGLVRAYTAAAQAGLESAGIVKMVPSLQLKVECEYSDYDAFIRILSQIGAKVTATEYLEKTEIKFALPEEKTEVFRKSLTEAFCGRLDFEIIGECYFEDEENIF